MFWERNGTESRRIDNQLRGRAGRQGDPGSSQFYLSMEDNLLRIFAAERMTNIMRRLGVKEEDVIEHPMITRAIERAQRRVEGINFDIRKNLLEYDDVANDQRKVIYQQRLELLQSEDISGTIAHIREEALDNIISNYIPPQSLEEQWDISGLEQQIQQDFSLKLDINGWLAQDDTLHEETLREKIVAEIANAYTEKMTEVDLANVQQIQKSVLLQVLDSHWRDHLAAMDYLRQGIHLRGYAQKNPAQEFKRESFNLFTEMLVSIKYEVIATLSKLQLVDQVEPVVLSRPQLPELHFQHAEITSLPGGEEVTETTTTPYIREAPKVGRNDPCPCGSGKKYKQCHGQLH